MEPNTFPPSMVNTIVCKALSGGLDFKNPRKELHDGVVFVYDGDRLVMMMNAEDWAKLKT